MDGGEGFATSRTRQRLGSNSNFDHIRVRSFILSGASPGSQPLGPALRSAGQIATRSECRRGPATKPGADPDQSLLRLSGTGLDTRHIGSHYVLEHGETLD